MKVIDLLNKIANGEEVPKKVKVGYYYYEYEENGEYINTENTEDLLFDFDSYYPLERCLNVEAEVIEEDKKIRKIKVNYSPDIEEKIFYEDGGKPNHCILGDAGTELLINKINEIIDYIMEDK